MKKRNLNFGLIALIFLIGTFTVFLSSCGNSGNKKTSSDNTHLKTDVASVDTSGAVNGDWVILREMADPEKLNPIVSNDASASEIDSYIYEQLNQIDNVTYELIPWLADLPEESPDHMHYTYHLKKNITFSDGKPMTGEDVVFTLKVIKNPYADDAALRNYFEMVQSAELVNGDPYTIKFTMNKPYWRARYSLGLTPVIPKHILDPDKLNDQIKFTELVDFNTAKGNKTIQQYADFINSQEVSRSPKYVVGSGPYLLEDWKTGQAVTLTRNENYWYKSFNPYYPKKIVFKTITDNSASVVAAKNKEIDAMYVISPIDFYRNLDAPEQFNLKKAKPSEPTYAYLTWNQLNPIFQDKKVRLALSHLVDRKTIVDKILYGDAVLIQSHIFYLNKKYLNDQLPPIEYDPEKAKQLLAEAGWKDSNGDGVLDKEINGKKYDFKFTFLSNNNPVRKQILLIVIDALKRVGIEAGLQDLEWTVFLDKTKKHEFDATYGAWQLSVVPEDPYQIWHSSQSQGEGSNIESFKNKESDELIEAFRNEFDDNKRIEIIKKWQQLIYDEQPYTFLWSGQSRYIYDARFKNTRWYAVSPSPKYNEWWVPKNQQKYTQTMQ
ncbi:MAG: hypothetical protein EHM58_14245 [Ignavibacteriae bacterium]|nr:MAG: hypothetical protein EHM58_14245 [Ignavibacteriota bacterium]